MMNRKPLDLDWERLKADLDATSLVPIGTHLDEEEFVRIAMQIADEEEAHRLQAHIDTCLSCAEHMDLLISVRIELEVENEFEEPTEQEDVEAARETTIAPGREAQTIDLTLFREAANEPIVTIAIAPLLEDARMAAHAHTALRGETADKSLAWQLDRDQRGDVYLIVASPDLALEGLDVVLRCADWSDRATFAKEGNSVLVEVRINKETFNRLPRHANLTVAAERRAVS